LASANSRAWSGNQPYGPCAAPPREGWTSLAGTSTSVPLESGGRPAEEADAASAATAAPRPTRPRTTRLNTATPPPGRPRISHPSSRRPQTERQPLPRVICTTRHRALPLVSMTQRLAPTRQ